MYELTVHTKKEKTAFVGHALRYTCPLKPIRTGCQRSFFVSARLIIDYYDFQNYGIIVFCVSVFERDVAAG